MDHIMKAPGRFAVAIFVAIAFLTFAFHPARPSKADYPPLQDAVKVEVGKKEAPVQAKTVEKRAVIAAPAVRAVGAVPAANLEQMTRQMTQQLRPILRVELRWLTSAADPTPAQRREIAIEGGRALKEVAAYMAGIRNGVNMIGRAGPAINDPSKVIHDAIEVASRAKLSPEQFARYQAEMERKVRDRNEVVMLNLVAKLDGLLALGVDQRARLCDSLRSHWDEWARPSLETLTLYDAYFPTIPDSLVNPFLTEEQRRIWQRAQKINFAQIRNAAFLNGIQNIALADDDEDEDVKAVLAEETKK
jgi:hypothetical protein